jgi:hypothetical protein
MRWLRLYQKDLAWLPTSPPFFTISAAFSMPYRLPTSRSTMLPIHNSAPEGRKLMISPFQPSRPPSIFSRPKAARKYVPILQRK